MIPIGTRCILLRADNPAWAPLVGKTVSVIGYVEWVGVTYCEVKFDDGSRPAGSRRQPLASLPPDIIPIGHDPDTETRTTDREVTA